MSALSRELGVSLSALTQIADRLERARLVKRTAAEDDRRVRCLQLTARGEKMMRSCREARVARARWLVRWSDSSFTPARRRAGIVGNPGECLRRRSRRREKTAV